MIILNYEKQPLTMEKVLVRFPCSEVMMYCRLADRIGYANIVRPFGNDLSEIMDLTGKSLTAPVLPSEAGFYRDSDGTYYYHRPMSSNEKRIRDSLDKVGRFTQFPIAIEEFGVSCPMWNTVPADELFVALTNFCESGILLPFTLDNFNQTFKLTLK